jgi:hypothetical protein
LLSIKPTKRFGATRQQSDCREADLRAEPRATGARGLSHDQRFSSGLEQRDKKKAGKFTRKILAGTTFPALASNFAAQQYRDESARSPATKRTLGTTGIGNNSIAKTRRAQPITSVPKVWTLVAMSN